MGPKHPTSLKLKKYNIWNSTLYKFNPSSLYDYGVQKNIINSIYHYFQYIIISKPVLHFENSPGVGRLLKIKFFYYNKPNFTGISTVRPPWNNQQIIKFEKILKEFYGYPIEIRMIKLNNPTLNANILAQLIAINLKTHGIGKIWRILLRKMKFKTPANKFLCGSLNQKDLDMHLNWMHILNKGIFCKEYYSHITGFKLKLSGRISKRKGASRTSTINRSIGTLQLNSINSSIDYGHIEKKDKNGSQSIKVYIANSIIFNPSSP